MITLNACAKVNLTLEVLGKRPDGFHEVRTVMQLVDLCDTLVFDHASSLELQCDVPELSSSDNLVFRAASMLQAAIGQTRGARIELEKHIPAAAGMGGGSSDAATALRGLNDLWQGLLPLDDLLSLAAKLGSDVPFFLNGPTALASGRGEKIEKLPSTGLIWFVFVKPFLPIAEKTAKLYGLLERDDYLDGSASASVAGALKLGDIPDTGSFCNSFDRVLLEYFPPVREAWKALEKAGSAPVHACGAGPTVFSAFASAADAERAARTLADGPFEVYTARTIGAEKA